MRTLKTIRYWLAAGCWLLAAGCWLPVQAQTTEPDSDKVSARYLTAVKRLGSDAITDYYFICNAKGTYVHWGYERYNDRASHLSLGAVTKIMTVSRNVGTIRYTISLLTKQPADRGEFELDSALTLSFNGTSPAPDSFFVICSTNTDSQRVNVGAISDAPNTVTTESVRLEKIASFKVARNQKNSHILNCQAQLPMLFRSLPNFAAAFNAVDRKIKGLIPDETIAKAFFILRSDNPQQANILSFITTDSEAINVTCGSSMQTASLQLRAVEITEVSTDISMSETSTDVPPILMNVTVNTTDASEGTSRPDIITVATEVEVAIEAEAQSSATSIDQASLIAVLAALVGSGLINHYNTY